MALAYTLGLALGVILGAPVGGLFGSWLILGGTRQLHMHQSPSLTETKGGMSYWHATQTFGLEAVTNVVLEGRWSERHPDLFRRIGSEDIRLKNTTVLPAETVREIAAKPECIYDFFADSDGVHLYAALRGEPLLRPFDVSSAKRIPTGEALSLYGGNCLYKAADTGVGIKGE